MKKRKIVADVKKEKVDIRAFGKANFVYIYLNEKPIKIESYDGAEPYDAFEYDYNEFVVDEADIDINDVKTNPEKYLDFVPLTSVSFEETQTDFNIDIDYRVSMLELGLV